MAAQDERLEAIAAAAAAMLRETPYHVVRAGDVAAMVRLPGQTGRSAVWLYNEVHNRRVLVALAAAHAWREFAGQENWSLPAPVGSVAAARSAAVAALGVIIAFHRAEQSLMTQVGYGIGDISTAEKRKLAAGTGLTPPGWPASPWGRVAAAAWHGRCDVFTDFLEPVLRACAESVTYLPGANVEESASRLSDVDLPDLPGRPRRPGRPARARPGGAVVRARSGPGGRRPAPGAGKRRDGTGRGGPAADRSPGRGERLCRGGPGHARGRHPAPAGHLGREADGRALAEPDGRPGRTGGGRGRSHRPRPAAAERRGQPPGPDRGQVRGPADRG